MRHLFGLVVLLAIGTLQACGGSSNRDQLASTQTPVTTGTLFTSAPSSITLSGTAAPASFAVGGGTAPYAANSADERVAIGRVSESTLTVTAIAAGTTQILVVDAVGSQVSIGVTIAGPTPGALFLAAPATVTVAPGAAPAGYAIGGGSPPYTVQSSNVAVTSAAVVGARLNITGLTLGNATVTVFDAAGAQASVLVTVSSSTGVALAVSPSGASGSVGDVLTFVLRGGSPGYTLSSNNTSIVQLSASSLSTSGSSFTATLKGAGDATVTVSDAQNQTAPFVVSVGTASPQLRLSPSAFLVGENELGQIALNIFGGTPPYTALSSDLVTASVSVVGSVLNTTPGTSLTRCINPVTDATPPVYVLGGTYPVTFTVIDSLGASGTSVMTIKDNGAGMGLGCP